MEKVNETNKWNIEQIETYASKFCEGDAIKAGNEWVQVSRRELEGAHYAVDGPNPYLINHHREGQLAIGISHGFSGNRVNSPYEIITPQDYEAQAGDKLVWLGKTQKQGDRSVLTFGKSYDVIEGATNQLIYKDDMSITILVGESQRWKPWGIIPKWKNVNKEVETYRNKDGFSKSFKVGDIVMSEYTVVNEEGRVEIVKMGGIINKADTSDNTYQIVFNNKLMKWSKGENIELVFNKDNQDFVETVINEDSKSSFKDISPEYKALKILLELENDNIHELLYRELNKEVMNTMDNLVESYEFDKVKSIVDAMKGLVFD